MNQLAKDCAACELVGYVIGLLKAGDVPELHREPLRRLIESVRETQGLDKREVA